jgi:hypothetical protein
MHFLKLQKEDSRASEESPNIYKNTPGTQEKRDKNRPKNAAAQITIPAIPNPFYNPDQTFNQLLSQLLHKSRHLSRPLTFPLPV